MAEKRARQATKVPFVNAAAAVEDVPTAAEVIADLTATPAPEPVPAGATLETSAPALAADAASAETIVDAETVPAPAPAPIAAAAAVAEPAVAASEVTEPVSASSTVPPLSHSPAPQRAVPPMIKGFMTMATAPEMTYASADKFQAMFGDVNERAKSAVEKTSKLAEELTELTKGNVEAIVASGRVAAKGAEAMTQEAAEFSKKSFESATGALKSFAAVKSPTELFQLQSEFAKSSFDSMVAEASKVSESMLKLMGEIAQPLSTRYAVAAEKLKVASTF